MPEAYVRVYCTCAVNKCAIAQAQQLDCHARHGNSETERERPRALALLTAISMRLSNVSFTSYSQLDIESQPLSIASQLANCQQTSLLQLQVLVSKLWLYQHLTQWVSQIATQLAVASLYTQLYLCFVQLQGLLCMCLALAVQLAIQLFHIIQQ